MTLLILSETLARIPRAIQLAPGASSSSRLEDSKRERERETVCKVS